MKAKTHKTGLAARDAAVTILIQLLKQKCPLDSIVEQVKEGHFGSLQLRDQNLAYSIVIFTLRHKGEIDAQIQFYLTQSLPKQSDALEAILQTAIAQILFMNIADHAAVDLAVDLAGANSKTSPYKKLVNGILRNLVRDKKTIKPDIMLNTPVWLQKIWQIDYGPERAKAIMQSNAREAALDLTVKHNPNEWAKRLNGTVLPGGTVRVERGMNVQELDGYNQGEWWVQDAAAAVPARLLIRQLQSSGTLDNIKVLDLCAAPGGKTAQLATSGAKVTALDISQRRLERLQENLSRLNLIAEIVQDDMLNFTPFELFDGVILDVPCSATGTIRRHPEVVWVKTWDQVATLQDLQRRMLRKAISFLKPGGVMVYCNCSLLKREGEDQIDWAVNALPVTFNAIGAEEVALQASLCVQDGMFRITPEMTLKTDGFFAARLKRS